MDGAAFATGDDFADALVGAALAGKEKMPLFLINNTSSNTEVSAYLKESQIEKVYFYGGEGVLPDKIVKEIILKQTESFSALQGDKKAFKAIYRFNPSKYSILTIDELLNNPELGRWYIGSYCGLFHRRIEYRRLFHAMGYDFLSGAKPQKT